MEQAHQLEAVWKNDNAHAKVRHTARLSQAGPCSPGVALGLSKAPGVYRLRYEHVIFDLPKGVNYATDAIVSSAKAVYVGAHRRFPR